jgi:hypothetical protein
MVLRDVPEVIYTGLKKQLGNPKEYSLSGTDLTMTPCKIPLGETD